MVTDITDFMEESDSEQQNHFLFKISFALALLGWLIIGSTLNTIIFSAFPLKLALPEWQLSFITALLSSSFALLVGSVLIVLALLINPKDNVLQRWHLTLSRLAGLFAILLVLVIPLQFFVGSRALKGQTVEAFTAINKLKGIVKGISAVKSEPELRAYVASLPNPPALPAKFDADFPVIKQRAIENITAQINAGINNLEIQKTKSVQVFLREAIRNTAQAILMATAFSVLANLSGKASNRVTKFFNAIL